MTFTRTYTANYNPGQPYDYVTVASDGSGETFAQLGITIRVFLKNCQGQMLAGVPAQQIALFNPHLCICMGGAISDAGTNANGMATFSGTMRAGGCVTSLDVYADGVFIGTLRGPAPGFVTVKINSPDPRNCHDADPFQTTFRGLASYTIPWVDVRVSGTVRSQPEVARTATWNVPSASRSA